LAGATEQLLGQHQVDCLISGGEPTVRLPDKAIRGIGGRNQQLALGLMYELAKKQWPVATQRFQRPLVFLSGGTDGEDGPTDAAGAWFDCRMLVDARDCALDDFLTRCDAYRFFERFGGLIKTGPTNTNVCDLRIAIAAKV
jgi:glycerate 2-kinase